MPFKNILCHLCMECANLINMCVNSFFQHQFCLYRIAVQVLWYVIMLSLLYVCTIQFTQAYSHKTGDLNPERKKKYTFRLLVMCARKAA